MCEGACLQAAFDLGVSHIGTLVAADLDRVFLGERGLAGRIVQGVWHWQVWQAPAGHGRAFASGHAHDPGPLAADLMAWEGFGRAACTVDIESIDRAGVSAQSAAVRTGASDGRRCCDWRRGEDECETQPGAILRVDEEAIFADEAEASRSSEGSLSAEVGQG